MKQAVLSRHNIVLPTRRKKSHKGQNGRVLIVGGSKEYVGAVALAGVAALRSGADTVTIASPDKTAWAINTLSPDLITHKLAGSHLKESHVRQIHNLSKQADVMLIGNGLGMHRDTMNAVQKLVRLDIQKVIDADALKAVTLNKINSALLTPHKKEFEIFCENSNIRLPKHPNTIQSLLGSNVLLLKGPVDTIISSDRIAQNYTGNEGMTKAGTGDVLAGMCAGLVSQGLTLFQAACTASFLTGAVGDSLIRTSGYSYTASDMLDQIRVMPRGLR